MSVHLCPYIGTFKLVSACLPLGVKAGPRSLHFPLRMFVDILKGLLIVNIYIIYIYTFLFLLQCILNPKILLKTVLLSILQLRNASVLISLITSSKQV